MRSGTDANNCILDDVGCEQGQLREAGCFSFAFRVGDGIFEYGVEGFASWNMYWRSPDSVRHRLFKASAGIVPQR